MTGIDPKEVVIAVSGRRRRRTARGRGTRVAGRSRRAGKIVLDYCPGRRGTKATVRVRGPIGGALGRSILSSGIGRPANSRRHGMAINRAHRADRLTRALSVAMPVFAYICR